jgi:hypothetical protein
MSKPISRAEMKYWVNKTWQECLDERGIMTDYERGYHQGKADALATQNPASCINRSDTNPRRPWVGLTDDEIKEIIGPWGDTPIKGYTRKLFDQIENKLREKNA